MKSLKIGRTVSLFSLLALTLSGTHRSQAAPLQPAKKVNVLYSTGFEAPRYFPLPSGFPFYFFRPGLLAGQNGFEAYEDNSLNAAQVVRGIASEGKQSVLIDGSRLSLFDGDYEGYFYPLFDYAPLSAGRPIITTFCDVMFQPARGRAGYAGIHVYDAQAEEFGGMHIDADSRLHYGNGEYRSIPVAKNRWHRLQMRFDFRSRITQFLLNGQPIGTAPFGAATGTRLSDADLLMESGSRPSAHKAYFDNFGVIASDS